jgi:2-oxo-3-hexenedioate decarboxylase/2-keto-4-pentenoate hydratase
VLDDIGCRAAAGTIAAARRDRRLLQPLAGDTAPRNESGGYRIQDAVHGLLRGDFGALAGYKIGCTSAMMQQYLSIPQDGPSRLRSKHQT